MSDTWIQTRNNNTFDFMEPFNNEIVIDDIAHALANICRFTGHCDTFYSVANHCLLGLHAIDLPRTKLQWLLHDAHEAYIGDISTPLARYIDRAAQRGDIIEGLKKRVQESIYEGLQVDPPTGREDLFIRMLDHECLNYERQELLNFPLRPWPYGLHPVYPLLEGKLVLGQSIETVREEWKKEYFKIRRLIDLETNPTTPRS